MKRRRRIGGPDALEGLELVSRASEGVVPGHPLLCADERVEKRPSIRAVWERWSAAGVPAAIGRDVEARVDGDGVLHFRLDKQAAYQERLELAKDSDPIDVRLKLIAYPAKPAEARRVAHSILAGAP